MPANGAPRGSMENLTLINDYYIRDRGKVQGPFTAEKLRLLAQRGRFGRHFEVSEDGRQWSRATEYPELFPAPSKRKRRVPESQVSDRPVSVDEFSIAEPEFDHSAGDPAIWFYAHDSQENGPVTFSALRSLAKQGQLSSEDLVWTDGMPDWSPALQIAGIWSEDPVAFGVESGTRFANVGHPQDAAPQAAGAAPLAIASLVLGILGTNFLFFLGSLLAVIFGHIALKQIRESRGGLTGRGLALGGLILGYAVVVMTIFAGVAIVAWLVAQQAQLGR